jgi:propionyl-CoA carboxylase alpha chain
MFEKILVANRGEIACRVFKTAARMGIKTVAVFSDADRRALHVEMADEAVHIGAPPSAESYLVIERIVQACKDTGAQAVHPGYGFLSENRAFAKALESEGIAFIGPGPLAIEAMGDKITSKKLADDAGVNTIPGFNDVIRDGDHALQIANEVGYPVMLKASAGGGGKGMRVAWDDAQCREGFERASNEARSSFGDDRVFIEKFIEQPRHIEIQIIADSHGNILYLGERECSLQRRHQKVIEEAPSPFVDEAMRKAMGEQAVALARAVQYKSAGTVELIVDADKNFYFLEMNTRLQVEHPVTELVTGLDLVELMIRVANGEKLPFTQDDVKLDGWAIESRIYAEDPLRNFLPSTGRLIRYIPPEETDQVRVDTGVFEGGDVSMYYDPMIAKLVTHGATRDQAIQHMRTALDGFYIDGVSHNIGFLAALVAHPRFAEGRISTNMIAEEYPEGFSAADIPHDDPAMIVAVAASINFRYRQRAAQISGQMSGHEYDIPAEWVVLMNDEAHPVSIAAAEGGLDVEYKGETFAVRSDWQFGQPLFRGTFNGADLCMQVGRRDLYYHLYHSGSEAKVAVVTPRVAGLSQHMPVKEPPDMSRFLLSPMPGLLTSLAVKPEQEVKAGEELAVVEAMKMQNTLRAERDGKVLTIHAWPGETLAVDQPIVEFE